VKSDDPTELVQYRARYSDVTNYNVLDGHTLLLINYTNIHFYGTVVKFNNKINKYTIDLIANDEVNDCERVIVSANFQPLKVDNTNTMICSLPANKLQRTTIFTDFATLRDVNLDCNTNALMFKRVAVVNKVEIEHIAKIWKLEVPFFHDSVHINSLLRLKPLTWLNDEIIDAYLNLLKDRDRKKTQMFNTNCMEYCRSYFASSQFYSKLTSYEKNQFNYDMDVKRWLHNPRFQLHLNEMDKLFIPINIENIHWVLVVVFVSDRKICYYDSLRGIGGKKYTTNILKWIAKECEIDNQPFNRSEWIIINNAECPQQDNGYDCGVFLLMNVDVLCDFIPLHDKTYNATSMPHFRTKIACDIVRGELLY
jgi:hypothetical protein